MLDHEILAIHEPTYRGMREVLDLYARGVRLTVDEAAAHAGLVARAASPTRTAGGTIVVLPIVGLMTYRPSFLSMLFGGTSVAQFTAEVRLAAFDTSVSTIIIPTDSPGGSGARS
jgi:ClpP class serine protease